MRKVIILALLAVCCSAIGFAEANDSITCVNDNDSAQFSIVVATITEVSIHAENKFKPGLLNYEYIAKMADEEVRICPLKDIDMDDSKYPDVELGETYVLVVKETATKKEILQTPTPYNRINPVSDLEKRTWEMKSYDAYNLNFGKVLPFQYILNLDIPDNVPADVKKIGEKFYKKVVKLLPEGKNRISLTKKCRYLKFWKSGAHSNLLPDPVTKSAYKIMTRKMKNSVIVPISVSAFSSGYNLSAKGGTGSYKWNSAGLLNADSARGIRKTYYNESGQPTSIEFTDKGHLDYTYSTSGARTAGSAHHPDGPLKPLCGRRATLVSERCYCGGFVFEGDSLIYANFPGGYFDGEGLPHYSHTDFQGNITMVTDRDGQLCQHTGYYPYGEPWREPAGQPYLYGGKERMRDGSLNDYEFSARRLNSALALWTAPDPMARDFSNINPYVYCASNPIRYVDPTGCEFTDAAKSVVDYYRININKRIEKEQKEIDKKTKKGDTKIEKNQRRIEELNGILDELKVLEESSTTYNVVEKNVNEQTIEWDNNRQEVLITLSDKENLVYISHEFLHAYQFETGQLDFLVDTNTKYKRILYNLTDEKAAHNRGRIFGGGDIYTNWSPSYDKLEDVDKRLGPLINLAKIIKLGEDHQTIFKYKGKLYKPKSKL